MTNILDGFFRGNPLMKRHLSGVEDRRIAWVPIKLNVRKNRERQNNIHFL